MSLSVCKPGLLRQALTTLATSWPLSRSGGDKNTRALGGRYERRAEKFLQARGLVLVARNYSCRHGEIDLIMRDDSELVFVEVRMRNNTVSGGAAMSVNARKKNKIKQSINHYLSKYANRPASRFDLVAFEAGDKTEPDWWRAVDLL